MTSIGRFLILTLAVTVMDNWNKNMNRRKPELEHYQDRQSPRFFKKIWNPRVYSHGPHLFNLNTQSGLWRHWSFHKLHFVNMQPRESSGDWRPWARAAPRTFVERTLLRAATPAPPAPRPSRRHRDRHRRRHCRYRNPFALRLCVIFVN